jgi:hypothetical protein
VHYSGDSGKVVANPRNRNTRAAPMRDEVPVVHDGVNCIPTPPIVLVKERL